MLNFTAYPDFSGKFSRSADNAISAGKNLFYRKIGLFIIFLLLFSVHIHAQDPWKNITHLPTARGATSASVINDKIYVIGGNTGAPNWIEKAENEVYDPSTEAWDTTKSSMPTPRGWLTSAVVNDTIYAIGGGYPTHSNKNEAYDPVTDTWTTKAPIPGVGRRGMQSCVVDGIIYVMGGNESSRDCFAYNPATNEWVEKTSIPVGGGGDLAVAVYNGKIYTFGGGYYTVGVYSSVYAYNPQTDLWDTTLTPMPTPRFAMQAYLVGTLIYVIGGSQGYGTALSTVEVYDPVNDTWEQGPYSMPVPLCFFSGAVTNDTIIYVISGTSNWATGDAAIWEYSVSVPVEFTSFTASANGNEITLNWSTATETNNRGFEVQRKSGIAEFTNIGFVAGNGTTTKTHSYKFTDMDVPFGNYTYRLKQIDFDGSYEYSKEVNAELVLSAEFELSQNYPNPFNPTTTIGYGIQKKSNVKITILNAIGEQVAAVLNGEKEPGYHQVKFNAANLPSGVYFYRIQAGDFIQTKKMILLK